YIGFNTLGIEDSRRQAKYGMQVTLVHQVSPDTLTITVFEQHVVRKDHGGTCTTFVMQRTVYVLQEIKLLVAGEIREVITARPLTAFLRTKRRICQHAVITLHLLAFLTERIRQEDAAFQPVQLRIHQRKPVSILHEFA